MWGAITKLFNNKSDPNQHQPSGTSSSSSPESNCVEAEEDLVSCNNYTTNNLVVTRNSDIMDVENQETKQVKFIFSLYFNFFLFLFSKSLLTSK